LTDVFVPPGAPESFHEAFGLATRKPSLIWRGVD